MEKRRNARKRRRRKWRELEYGEEEVERESGRLKKWLKEKTGEGGREEKRKI